MSIGSPNSPIRIEDSTLNKKRKKEREIMKWMCELGEKIEEGKRRIGGVCLGGFRRESKTVGFAGVMRKRKNKANFMGYAFGLITNFTFLFYGSTNFYLGKTFLEFAIHNQNYSNLN